MSGHRTENAGLAIAALGLAFFGTQLVRSPHLEPPAIVGTFAPSSVVGSIPPGLCGPACRDPRAADDVDHAQAMAGPRFVCWAEPNREMPRGYEVLCGVRGPDAPTKLHPPKT